MADPFSLSPDDPTVDAAGVGPVGDAGTLQKLAAALGQTWPAHMVKAALSAAALPGDVYSGQTTMAPPGMRREDVTDVPGAAQPADPVIGRAADMAGSVMLGGMPAAGMLSKPGEMSLGIVPVDVARAFRGVPNKLPQDENFLSAVRNTPGARIEENSLTLPVARRQLPDQEGADSVRGGVFYLPAGSEQFKHYTGRGGYGGTQKIEGETAYKNPLVVKGATGGKAPEMAFDQLNGKGSYDAMRSEALNSLGRYGARDYEKADLVRAFLDKHAPEMSDLAEHIVASSTKGNQLPYALQEAAVASAARRAGHDSVIGYSVRRTDKQPFISEVYDVRENSYPGRNGDFSTWGPEAFGVKE